MSTAKPKFLWLSSCIALPPVSKFSWLVTLTKMLQNRGREAKWDLISRCQKPSAVTLSSWLYKQRGRSKSQVKFAVNFKSKEILLVNWELRLTWVLLWRRQLLFTVWYKFVTAEITFQTGNREWYSAPKELQEQLAQRLKYVSGHLVQSFWWSLWLLLKVTTSASYFVFNVLSYKPTF